MNTVVSIVGPWCSGKSTFLDALQLKFLGKTRAELVFPTFAKVDKKMLTTRRNEALEDLSKMYEFLEVLINNRIERMSGAFRALEARQFLFGELSLEYLNLMVEAARNIRLISKEQWKQLRRRIDEAHLMEVTDVFVLISNEEYEVCANAHKGTGWTEHKPGSVLQRWNQEMEALHPRWILRQKAKGKIVFESNARISRFARGLKIKKLMNVVLHFANNRNGTDFPLFPTAAAAKTAVEIRIRMGENIPKWSLDLKSFQPQVEMPAKKKPTATASGTVMGDLNAERLDEEAKIYQLQVKRMKKLQEQAARSRSLPGSPQQRSNSAGPMMRPVRPIPGPGLLEDEQNPLLGARLQGQLKPRVSREEEKERLRRRLAELEQEDEHQKYGGREVGQKTFSGRVKKKESFGKKSKEEKKFGRKEQERMVDSRLRKQMQLATKRMLASTIGVTAPLDEGFVFTEDQLTTYDDESEEESVSSDSSQDDSDEEEKKRKIRKKNEEKKERRKEREEQALVPSSRRTNYGPPDYSRQSKAATLTYVQGGGFGRSNTGYHQDDFMSDQQFDREFQSGRFIGLEERAGGFRDQGAWTPPDYSQEGSEEEYEGEEELEVAESERFEEDMDMSQENEESESEVEDTKTDVPEVPQPRLPPGPEVTGKQGGRHRVKRKSTEVAPPPEEVEEVEKDQEKEKDLEKGKKESKRKEDNFAQPQRPPKPVKRKIVKVSPEGPEMKEGIEKKAKITQEEMTSVLAKLKQEKVTPPKLSNTMKSTQLKSFLLATGNEEMSFEMDVPGEKHFPKTSHKSPESLKELIPKLQKKVFNTPVDVFHPEEEELGDEAQTVEPNEGSVSLSLDELEGVQALVREDEQAEMMRALQESKKVGFLEEEARRAAWAALGHNAPGTSGQATESGKPGRKKLPAKEVSQHKAGKTSAKEDLGKKEETAAGKRVQFKADASKKERPIRQRPSVGTGGEAKKGIVSSKAKPKSEVKEKKAPVKVVKAPQKEIEKKTQDGKELEEKEEIEKEVEEEKKDDRKQKE